VRRVAALLVLAGFAATAAQATATQSLPIRVLKAETPTLTVKLSSSRAGAKDVTLTLSYMTALRCGHPSTGVTVDLPAAAGVAAKIAGSAVHMNGRPVSAVVVRKHSLAVSPPRVSGVTCDSIVNGTVTLVLGAGAEIANPAHAGTYQVSVASGTSHLTATYSVS
jgi:hypothetical protein